MQVGIERCWYHANGWLPAWAWRRAKRRCERRRLGARLLCRSWDGAQTRRRRGWLNALDEFEGTDHTRAKSVDMLIVVDVLDVGARGVEAIQIISRVQVKAGWKEYGEDREGWCAMCNGERCVVGAGRMGGT